MKARLAKGWNTWDTRSVLSHVLLPAGFSINLRLVSSQTGDTLNEALPGRGDDGAKEHVIPGPHAWDGSYTEVVVEWQNIHIRVQTAAEGNDLFLLVSPRRQSPGDALVLDPQMLWGKPEIRIKDSRIRADTPSGQRSWPSPRATPRNGQELGVLTGRTHCDHDRSSRRLWRSGDHSQGRGSLGRLKIQVSRGADAYEPCKRAGLEHDL
jgi:hypothetical protein